MTRIEPNWLWNALSNQVDAIVFVLHLLVIAILAQFVLVRIAVERLFDDFATLADKALTRFGCTGCAHHVLGEGPHLGRPSPQRQEGAIHAIGAHRDLGCRGLAPSDSHHLGGVGLHLRSNCASGPNARPSWARMCWF